MDARTHGHGQRLLPSTILQIVGHKNRNMLSKLSYQSHTFKTIGNCHKLLFQKTGCKQDLDNIDKTFIKRQTNRQRKLTEIDCRFIHSMTHKVPQTCGESVQIKSCLYSICHLSVDEIIIFFSNQGK